MPHFWLFLPCHFLQKRYQHMRYSDYILVYRFWGHWTNIESRKNQILIFSGLFQRLPKWQGNRSDSVDVDVFPTLSLPKNHKNSLTCSLDATHNVYKILKQAEVQRTKWAGCYKWPITSGYVRHRALLQGAPVYYNLFVFDPLSLVSDNGRRRWISFSSLLRL